MQNIDLIGDIHGHAAELKALLVKLGYEKRNGSFRHTKWRKSAEDCWKQLQKGEYDWAHLAYSIWPDRVKEKCKKDLSMVIAHGLEDVCEMKPKENKTRKKNGVEIQKQQKLI